MKDEYRYIYGPVHSWRLGVSLGIDPLSAKEKICNYDCVYCQLGPTRHLTQERKIFVPTKELVREVLSFRTMPLDVLTFSGRGEPTLAANLGEMIRLLKKLRPEKVAVITNASLLHRADVQDDLASADVVLAKLDADCPDVFEQVDRTHGLVDFDIMVKGIKAFRRIFSGRLVLQMMFTAENIRHAHAMADAARDIGAHEIEINTPTRLCLSQALSEQEVSAIKPFFHDLEVATVYEHPRQTIEPINRHDAARRHGRYLSS